MSGATCSIAVLPQQCAENLSQSLQCCATYCGDLHHDFAHYYRPPFTFNSFEEARGFAALTLGALLSGLPTRVLRQAQSPKDSASHEKPVVT